MQVLQDNISATCSSIRARYVPKCIQKQPIIMPCVYNTEKCITEEPPKTKDSTALNEKHEYEFICMKRELRFWESLVELDDASDAEMVWLLGGSDTDWSDSDIDDTGRIEA